MVRRPKTEEDGKDVVALDAGQQLYHQGDPGDTLYVVEDGEVELLVAANGGSTRPVVVGRGEFFGEGSVLDGRPRESTARAVSACRLVPIDGPTLAGLVRDHPELALHMIRRLSARLAAAYASPAEPANAGPPVAARLLHESGSEFALPSAGEVMVGRSDRSSKFTPPIDLAKLVPADAPRSVSRRHAVLLKDGGAYHVRELPGVANGTWVNGTKLAPGVATRLAAGDVISFGPVKLVFHG